MRAVFRVSTWHFWSKQGKVSYSPVGSGMCQNIFDWGGCFDHLTVTKEKVTEKIFAAWPMF